MQELNFHLAEYSSGRLSSLDTVNATPTKLKSVEGVIQEWISNEVKRGDIGFQNVVFQQNITNLA